MHCNTPLAASDSCLDELYTNEEHRAITGKYRPWLLCGSGYLRTSRSSYIKAEVYRANPWEQVPQNLLNGSVQRLIASDGNSPKNQAGNYLHRPAHGSRHPLLEYCHY